MAVTVHGMAPDAGPICANVAIRILIADEYQILREGLRMLLETQRDFAVIGEADGAEDAWRLVHEVKPDILLLDLGAPHLAGLEILCRLADENSSVRTLLLVEAIERGNVIRALELGARGIVL